MRGNPAVLDAVPVKTEIAASREYALLAMTAEQTISIIIAETI